jgi:NAD(P)-dependent dehydrogenase (short-subunit alcohol dehydrogenase family)
VVVITGCSSGIGRALAFEFHRRGYRTFATARRPESVRELSEQGLEAVHLDVAESSSIKEGISTVIERTGRIDILVNNAGFNPFGPIVEVPIEQIRSLFETNVIGPIALIQEVFRYMVQQGSGRIVNIGSAAGLLPNPFGGPYSASKAALHLLSEVLRIECAPFGIDVVVVQPGSVRSNIATTGSIGLDRYQSQQSHYRAIHPQIVRRANASQLNPMPAEEFAAKLVQEVTKKEAPRVIRLGTGADFIAEMAKRPGPELERIFAQQFDLDSLRK